jgi:alkanesulfonate monooxygenase SsuD/methylene tetrahydromethanopterin reductase-like flavin-dependent oxidoreductase (luciferase family)
MLAFLGASAPDVPSPRRDTIIFRVGREKHGWAIRIGDHMMTPFWSKPRAIDRAHHLANALRSHGQDVEVTIEIGA